MKKRLFFLGIAICLLLSGRSFAQTAPTASFSLSQASVCVGGTVQVTDQSTDAPTLWTYTIDGTSTETSTLQSPVLTFTAAGVYSISLISENATGPSSVYSQTLMAFALPNVTAGSSVHACAGETVVLGGSGATSYVWTGGITDSVAFSPLATTVYTVTGTDGNGCKNTATQTVVVNSLPLISVNSGTICAGVNFTFIPTGAVSYTYALGTNIVSPSSTTSYTIIGEDANGCINTAVSDLTVRALPVISATNGAICSGDSFTIAPSGAASYTISGGSFVVSPASNASYSITGTSADGCISADTAIVNIVVSPIPTISISDGTICSGQSFVLSPSGASTYTFSNGSAIVSPIADTTYAVIGTSSAGCVASNTVICHVTVNKTPTISVNSGSICAGDSFTMNPIGAVSYTFSSGSSVVSPLSDTAYTVTGASSNGCVSQPLVAWVNVSKVVLTISGNTGVCLGKTTTLTATGASSYTWANGPVDSSMVITPGATAVYTVSGTNVDGCSNSETVTVTSFSLPVITVNPASPTVCVLSPVSFTASGANTYTWNGTILSASVVFTPAANTTYTVRGTDGNGCRSHTVVPVATNSLPVISITPGSLAVCPLSAVDFTASGATTYTWNNNNSSTGNSFTDHPANATTYTVVGTDAQGCSSSATVAVSMMAVPPVAVTPTIAHVCPGDSVSFTASGAQTFTWSNSVIGNATSIAPATNTVAYVVGTGTNGCTTMVQFAVLIHSLPVISVLPASATVCQNISKTFTATGANTYTWSTSVVGNTAVLTASTNTVYTVTGTDSNGCVNSKTVGISAFAVPSITVYASSFSVCPLTLVNLSASGALTYTWSNNIISGMTAVTPNTSSTYTVTGKNMYGCTSSAVANIHVWQLPVISVSPASPTVCAKDLVTLTATGANTYTWDPFNVSGSTYTSTPSTTFTHYVYGTDNNGCVNSTSVTVYVNKCVGIEENRIEKQINVYPNPSTGFITVALGLDGEKEILVYNALGTIVEKISTTNSQESIDLSSKPKGVYVIKVSSKTDSFSHKVIIQ